MHREKSICYKTKQILAKLGEEPGETGGRYSRCSCDYVSEFFFIFSTNSENSCMGRSKKGPTLVKTLKFGRDIDRQSWNPAFYPLRSPDPLPSASGSGLLTRSGLASFPNPLALSRTNELVLGKLSRSGLPRAQRFQLLTPKNPIGYLPSLVLIICSGSGPAHDGSLSQSVESGSIS